MSKVSSLPGLQEIILRVKQNRTTVGMVLALIVLLIGGFFLFKQFGPKIPELPIQEVDLPFDPEGPYAILTPRADGDALILNITRVSSYKAISYELAYQSESDTPKNLNTKSEDGESAPDAIDRGVTGTIDLKSKKSEYSQEILFGTCSQGYTSGGAHCVFDKGVENGTLTLRIEKELEKGAKVRTVYKMITTWHLQKPDVALGKLASADSHFMYETTASRADLANVGYSIINDLSGTPKLPDGKVSSGKVYALNVPNTRTMPNGKLTIEIADNPPSDAKIGRYAEGKNEWEMLETQISGSKLTANVSGQGIFAVLVSKK